MTVTVASFRRSFTEFAEAEVYPNASIDYYIALAGKLLNNPARWGELEDDGRMLFIAHHIVLEKRALEAAEMGGDPGVGGGVVNQKSVDKVSVGYDTQAGTIPGAGHWNLTMYGIRLKQLFDMVGAGPVQVGIGHGGPLGANAWPGPSQSYFPNGSG